MHRKSISYFSSEPASQRGSEAPEQAKARAACPADNWHPGQRHVSISRVAKDVEPLLKII